MLNATRGNCYLGEVTGGTVGTTGNYALEHATVLVSVNA